MRKRCFDLETQLPGGFLGTVERQFVGNALTMAVLRVLSFGRQLFIDLRPETMHQHDLDAHRVQDR